MMTIVEAARECLDTKFHHQGRLVGSGLDCIGLIVHVAKRCGFPIQDCTDYGRLPYGGRLLEEITRNLDRIESPEVGAVGVFWVRRPGLEQHVAIFTDYGMIHTYQNVGRVVETRFASPWTERLSSVWKFRRVA